MLQLFTTVVICDYHPIAWMTRNIFACWHDKRFIPHIKEYHQKTKKSSKILLIIDNAPHLSSELIEHENGLHKVPMHRAVIQSSKKRYRKELLQRIGLSDADGDNMVSQHRSINLKDCSYITVQVWSWISGSPSISTDYDDDFSGVKVMVKYPELL
ncbi:Jerky -like protein-like [Trichinella spiralis]|uniref:Jerky-like protein-like n=1 Tax=Trichinella spiralis TaxID=6334 RepID=A0A0V1AQL7_TRISP|nr:Jerky -like protein-like [Trichinella spiralis]